MATVKETLLVEARKIMDARKAAYEKISAESPFVAGGGQIYPYDTLGSNLDLMFSLFQKSGFISDLESNAIKTVCDIGCANGELALTFAASGFDTTAIDYTFKHDRAPYVAKRFSEELGLRVAVADLSVDKPFTIGDVKDSLITDVSTDFSNEFRFDLVICFGLLYHLKNPYSFVESLARISKRVLLGTWVITHLPDLRVKVDADPVAWLLDAQDNSDPTNYWFLTEAAFHRIVRRCGFDIEASFNIPNPNNPLEVAVPNRADLGIRSFVALRTSS
ncbi:methyltransferase domain-containing protein [Reyranella sp.]|uniref:class I SAM-dependent methyltransferase n=1 Tax=Reyranella sp. TaxID=1929291 RepID=UPI001206ECBD|nr:methyltransferase domain-containing protein [Reyranella sp.]TAJ90982.1 MAG: methyltransferase domain-containing protein [Reyranella sp.]